MSDDNVWIDLPDFGLEELESIERTHASLTAMTQRIEGAESVQSLEAYELGFESLLSVTQLPAHPRPAFESYRSFGNRQMALKASIENQKELLADAIVFGIEDYTDTFGSSLENSIEKMSKARNDLQANVGKFDDLDGPISVSNYNLRAFFHRDGRQDGMDAASTERREVEKLLGVVSKASGELSKLAQAAGDEEKFNSLLEADGVGKALAGIPRTSLLFNRTVQGDTAKGSFKTDQVKVERKSSPWKGALVGGLIGGIFGLSIPGAAVGYYKSKDSKDITKSDTDKAKRFLKEVGDLEGLHTKIESEAEKLSKIVEGAGDQKSKVKRQAADVMKLLGYLTNHITECIYAGSALAKKAKPMKTG